MRTLLDSLLLVGLSAGVSYAGTLTDTVYRGPAEAAKAEAAAEFTALSAAGHTFYRVVLPSRLQARLVQTSPTGIVRTYRIRDTAKVWSKDAQKVRKVAAGWKAYKNDR